MHFLPRRFASKKKEEFIIKGSYITTHYYITGVQVHKYTFLNNSHLIHASPSGHHTPAHHHTPRIHHQKIVTYNINLYIFFIIMYIIILLLLFIFIFLYKYLLQSIVYKKRIQRLKWISISHTWWCDALIKYINFVIGKIISSRLK